jgi:hypothetical protein
MGGRGGRHALRVICYDALGMYGFRDCSRLFHAVVTISSFLALLIH